MLKDLIMPRMGDAATEGWVERWEKGVGDSVQMGEVIGAVSVDKATYDLESPWDGVLAQILLQPQVAVPVGTPIARIEIPA